MIKKGNLKIEELPDGSIVNISYIKITSNKKGPVTGIVATQHGNEFFSIAILNQFLKKEDLTKIKGELLIFPIANPLAFNVKERVSQIDKKDMNRCWPGKKTGTITQRMCSTMFIELKKCKYILDLHNGNDNILDTPQARIYDKRFSLINQLINHLDVPFILLRDLPLKKTLVSSLLDLNKEAITVEIGEGKRMELNYLKKGVAIIKSFLNYTGNLGHPSIHSTKKIDSKKLQRVHADKSGLFIPKLDSIGKRTNKIGTMLTFPEFEETKIVTDKKGYILSLWVGGVVNEGELICRITKDD